MPVLGGLIGTLGDNEGETLGLIDGLTLGLTLGLILGDSEGETLGEMDGEMLGETLGLILGEIDAETLGKSDAETEAETDALGERLGGLVEGLSNESIDGDCRGEIYPFDGGVTLNPVRVPKLGEIAALVPIEGLGIL